MIYHCAICNCDHDGFPSWGTDRPEDYWEVPEDEREQIFLSSDACVIDDEKFFVRCCIEIPVLSDDETYLWGVWVSLTADDFFVWQDHYEEPQRSHIGPFSGQLCTSISSYPTTTNLTGLIHLQDDGQRPRFVCDPADHPLVQHQQEGIPFEVLSTMMHELAIRTRSAISKAAYHEHVAHFGEPDHSIRFGNGIPKVGKEHFPSMVEIMIWRPTPTLDITTFATIGMSDFPMAGVDFRVEVHFAVRGDKLTETDEYRVATYLANVSAYPFANHSYFDWWQTLANPGDIPLFSPNMALLLHPKFVENGWDKMECEGTEVRILTMIPITQSERQLKLTSGQAALCKHWEDANIDLFKPR